MRVVPFLLAAFALAFAMQRGSASAQDSEIVMGNVHTCAVSFNRWVKCWGSGAKGALGLNDTTVRGDNSGEMGNSLPWTLLPAKAAVASLVAGGDHNCAIMLADNSVKCWGYNNGGQLGIGDALSRGDNTGEMGSLPAVQLGGKAIRLTAGQAHSCAILDDGSVKCWGINSEGELGQGSTSNRGDGPGEMGTSLQVTKLGTGRKAIAISGGGAHTCALLDNGTVKCWGYNASGQLGLGNTTNRGTTASQMGDSLPAVSLGTGRTALAISAGGLFSCALLDNHKVKCWGDNSQGELGIGATGNRGDNASEMGDALPAVNLGTGRTAIAIAAGFEHACALLDNNTVKCWGGNAYGQLGYGDTRARGTAAADLGNNLPAVSLGTSRTARSIAASNHATCAVLDNAKTKCWGNNSYGRLGLGNTLARGDAAGEMGDSLPVVATSGCTPLTLYPSFCKEWIPWSGGAFTEPTLPATANGSGPVISETVTTEARMKELMAMSGLKKITVNGNFGPIEAGCNKCEISIPSGSSIARWSAAGGGWGGPPIWTSSYVRVSGPGRLGAIEFIANSTTAASNDIIVDGVEMKPDMIAEAQRSGVIGNGGSPVNRILFMNLVAQNPLIRTIDDVTGLPAVDANGQPLYEGEGWLMGDASDLGMFNCSIETHPEESAKNSWIYRHGSGARIIIADSYFRGYRGQQAVWRQGSVGHSIIGVYLRNNIFVKGGGAVDRAEDGLLLKDEQTDGPGVIDTNEDYADHNTFMIDGPLSTYAAHYPGESKKWIITNTDWRTTDVSYLNESLLNDYEAECVRDPDPSHQALCRYKAGNTYTYGVFSALVPAWPDRYSPYTKATLKGDPSP